MTAIRAADLTGLSRADLERLAAEQAAVLEVIRKAADALGTRGLPRYRAELVALIAQAAAGHLTAAEAFEA